MTFTKCICTSLAEMFEFLPNSVEIQEKKLNCLLKQLAARKMRIFVENSVLFDIWSALQSTIDSWFRNGCSRKTSLKPEQKLSNWSQNEKI